MAAGLGLSERLATVITCNGSQAIAEFKATGVAAERSLKSVDEGSKRTAASLTRAGVGMAAFGGVALFGLYKAAQAAQEEDLAISKLNTAFQNSPVLVGQTTDALIAQAAALQDTTVFADDATINMDALLATFRLTSDEIEGLAPRVQDLAAFWNVDLTSAAKAVGKAMQGNIGALQRQGIHIDEAAFATDRYSAVMSALRENAGGFAAEEGATFNGQLTIMKNNLQDVAEGIGRGAVSAFNDLLGPVTAVSDKFQELSPETQSMIGRFATFGAVGLTAAGGMSFLAGQVITGIARFKDLKATLLENKGAMLGVAAAATAIALAAANWDKLGEGIDFSQDLEHVNRWLSMTTDQINEAGAAMAVAGSRNDMADMFSALAGQGERGIAVMNQLKDAAIEAGADPTTVLGALADALATVDTATQAAADSAAELGQRWSGLNNSLSRFDAATQAADAGMQLAEAWHEASQEGGIASDEMIGLRHNISGVVSALRDQAEANHTNSQGVVNTTAANRELRQSLAAVASFIPSALLPQFRRATSGLGDVAGAAHGIPSRIDITVTAVVAAAIANLNAIAVKAQAVADLTNIATSVSGHAHGGFIRQGESGFISHGGERVQVTPGGAVAVTPHAAGGGGTVELGRSTVRALARELAEAMAAAPSSTMFVRG